MINGLSRGKGGKGKINLEKSSFAISANQLLNRRHPLSPWTSSQGDAQTACHFDKKKCYRILFENVPIKQIPPSPVVSCPGELTNHQEESAQTQVATAFPNQAKKHP